MIEKKKELMTTISMLLAIIIFIFSLISIITSPKIVARLKHGGSAAGSVNFAVLAFNEKDGEFLANGYGIRKAVVEITITNKNGSEVLFTEKIELKEGERYEKNYDFVYEYLETPISFKILEYSVKYNWGHIANYFILILSLAIIILLLLTEVNFKKNRFSN